MSNFRAKISLAFISMYRRVSFDVDADISNESIGQFLTFSIT